MIPKIAHFYWGEKTLPYMRYLTIASFLRYNPGWRVKLYTPTIGSSLRTWPTHEHQYELNVKDYYDMLPIAVERCKVDLNDIGGSNNWSEVHKSDYLRWYLLSTEGGLWSDMDIVYLAPAPGIPKSRANDGTGVCINPAYGHSVGFLVASKLNPFYTDVFRLARLSYKAEAYQCLGADLLNREYHRLNAIQQQFSGVFNIHMDMVYPYDATRIFEIYGDGDPVLPTMNIGIHWYAGHGLAGEFQLGKLPHCLLAKILKREGYDAEFYNSNGHCK
jgi:hypothetical protein